MIKRFAISKNIKRLFIILCVCLIGLTLASCDSSNRKSAGELDRDAVYASALGQSVTVGELYDEFRFNATTYVEDQAYKAIYKEEIEKVEADLKKDDSQYKERMVNTILKDIYDTDDLDEIAKLSDDEVNHEITEYIDYAYEEGYLITKEDILNKNFSSLYPRYYLEVAKYVAAYNALKETIGVKEDGSIDFGDLTSDDAYFTDDEVVDWFKDNRVDKGDVTGILVRFINSTEATNLLRVFGIVPKSGYWYQISLTDEAKESKNKYEEYYDKQAANFSPSADEGISSIEDTAAGMGTILRLFIEVYNYVYTFRDPIVVDALTIDTFVTTEPSYLKYYYFAKAIIEAGTEYRNAHLTEGKFSAEAENTYINELMDKVLEDEDNAKYFVLSNERLNKYDSSLASYVYKTLATEAKDGESTYTRYTSSAESKGDYYYLFFKASQVADPVLYTEGKDSDGNTTYDFTGHEDLLNEVLMEMFEDELTDTFISEKFDERVKEAELQIFDSIVELNFTRGSSTLASNYKKCRKTDNNSIAKISYNGNDTWLTVEDFFKFEEALNGPTTALTLLFNKYLKTTDEYKEEEGKYDEYLSSLKNMLALFANDYYSSYGYSASLGKYDFMRLLYHSSVSDTIIRDNMMVSAVSAKYIEDFTKFFTLDEFLNKLADYAVNKYVEYYNMSATVINIYTDRDEDNEPDELTADDPIYADVQELLAVVLDYINRSSETYTTALNNFISAYNTTARIGDLENPTTNEYLWAKYRAKGLYVSTSSISELTNSSKGNDEFREMVEDYYNDEKYVNPELGLTSNLITTEGKIVDNKYQLLILTGATLRKDASYDDKKLIAEIYSTIPSVFDGKLVETTFTEDDFVNSVATKNAMKVYLYDYLLLGEVYSLPASTTEFLTEYFKPLLDKYTSTASQQTIKSKYLGNITFSYSQAVNPAGNEAFNNAYSRNGYLDRIISITQQQDDDYANTYVGWWENLYKEAK